MKQQLVLAGEHVEYVVKRSTRARRLRLAMHVGGELVVTVPMRVSLERVESMLQTYAAWILRQRTKMKARPVQQLPAIQDRAAYLAHQGAAKELVTQYLAVLMTRETLPRHSVQIKNHRTRWGSCSKRGNLNFNYRILLLPIELAEYIIIHEVCHLFEMNHSSRFWNRVARFLPDYATRRKQLRNYSWKKDE
jgi:predicted metal-dependent hydrolase